MKILTKLTITNKKNDYIMLTI